MAIWRERYRRNKLPIRFQNISAPRMTSQASLVEWVSAVCTVRKGTSNREISSTRLIAIAGPCHFAANTTRLVASKQKRLSLIAWVVPPPW